MFGRLYWTVLHEGLRELRGSVYAITNDIKVTLG